MVAAEDRVDLFQAHSNAFDFRSKGLAVRANAGLGRSHRIGEQPIEHELALEQRLLFAQERAQRPAAGGEARGHLCDRLPGVVEACELCGLEARLA